MELDVLRSHCRRPEEGATNQDNCSIAAVCIVDSAVLAATVERGFR